VDRKILAQHLRDLWHTTRTLDFEDRVC